MVVAYIKTSIYNFIIGNTNDIIYRPLKSSKIKIEKIPKINKMFFTFLKACKNIK